LLAPIGDAKVALRRSHWAARLRAFVETGPEALPAPEAWFGPSAADVAGVLLPLVARRTLKRLLLASLHLRAPPALAAEWDRLVSALLELPDDALTALLGRPEVTGLVAGAEDSPEDGEQLVLWLGQVVAGAMAAHGGDLPPTRIARSTPRTVALPAASTIAVLEQAETRPVVATVRMGRVVLSDAVVAWQPLPVLAERAGVSTGRDAWLDRTFPGIEHVAELDVDGTERFIRSLEEGARVLRGVWPEAHDELLATLRWVVPLAGSSSWYVPGMQGLVALGVHSGRRQVRDLFHETSHHKLSRVLELASATKNPDHLVFSPFAKGKKEPVTSLLQSCWSFSREYVLIQRLKASGTIQPAEIAREERKFRVFFDKGIPVLRREARLTEIGDALLTCIEAAIR
jgi:HEXXH motif-containing protein